MTLTNGSSNVTAGSPTVQAQTDIFSRVRTADTAFYVGDVINWSITVSQGGGGGPVQAYFEHREPSILDDPSRTNSTSASGVYTVPSGLTTLYIFTTRNSASYTGSVVASATCTPISPSVTALGTTTGAAGGGTSVVITGASFTGATSVKFGSASATFTVDSDTQITATSPAGSGTVDVKVTNSTGTSPVVAADHYTYVTAAPTVTSFTASSVVYNTGSASATSIDVSGHATGSPTSYAVGSATTAQGGSVSINSSGLASYTPPTGYRGSDSFTFTATNGSGASATSATVTVPVGDPTLGISLTGSGATQGTALSGYSIAATGGKAPYTCSTTPASGSLPAGVSLSSGCALSGTPTGSGASNFTVSVTDSSTGTGHVTQTSSTLSLSVASNGPVAGPVSAYVQIGGNVQVDANLSGPSANSITITSQPAHGTASVNGLYIDLDYSITSPTFSGTDTFTYTATNSSGTSAPATVTVHVNSTAPYVSGELGIYSSVNGGASLTFSGTNLSAATVTVAGVPATVTANTATSVTITTPPGTGTQDVVFTTAAGYSLWTGGVIYLQPDTVSAAFSPTTVANGGTSRLTFTVSKSDSYIHQSMSFTTALPGGLAVAATPNVSTTGACTGFTFSPSAGSSSISMTGGRLSGGPSSCAFSVDVTVSTSGTKTVTPGGVSPPNTTVGGSLILGTAGSPASLSVTATPAPTVTAISPALGATTGGASVTLTGAGFTGATGVTIGGAAATNVVVVGATSITATTPAGSAGTASVVVTTSAGANSANTLYTYVAPPVAGAVSATVSTNSTANAIALVLSGGTATNVALGTGPSHGTATVSGTAITYTPAANYAGPDSFTYTAANAGGTSAPATVSLTVGAGALSTVQAVAATTLIQGVAAAAFTPVTTSGGTGTLTYAVSPILPAGLSFSPTTGQITGTPTATLAAATFTVTVSDQTAPTAQTASKTFSLTVNPMSPVAGAVSASVAVNSPATPIILVLSGGAASSVAIGTSPSHGTATVSGISISYAPAPNYAGPDSFTYTATNVGGSSTATVSVTVSASALSAAQAVASTTLIQGVASTPFTPVTASGGTGTLTYAVSSTLPAGLSFSPTTGQITGTPTATLAAATFTVTVSDQTAPTVQTASKTFSLTVNPVTPIASAVSASVATNAAATPILLSMSGGTATSVALGTGPNHGAATVSGTSISYTPAPNYAGPDSFTYTAANAGGTSAPATVSLTINPTAISAAQTVASTTLIQGAAAVAFTPVTASGGAGTLTYAVSPALPQGLSFDTTSGQVSGTPTVSLAPTLFTVSVIDQTVPNAQTASKTFSLAVNGIPTAGAASGVAAYNATAVPITLTLSGAPALSVAIATPASHGTATASGTTIAYTPAVGYFGPDSFTYTATGLGGTSPAASVSVTVNAPVIVIGQTAAPNGQQSVAYTTTLTASGGAAPYSFALQAGSTLPTGLTLSSTGVLSGTPSVQGNYSFAVAVTDSSTGAAHATGTQTLSLTLGAPPAPTATAKAMTIAVTASAGGSASVAPTNIDLSTSVTNATGIVILTPPQHGTATVNGFVVIYAPTPGYFGADSFTYAAVGLPGSSMSASLDPRALGAPTIFGAGVGVGLGLAQSAGAVVNISIPAPTVTIQQTSLPGGMATSAYRQVLTAAGGTAPYSFTLSSGALPAGLSLSSAGVISGAPTAAGPFTFTVKATDSSTGSGPFFATQTFALILAPLVPTAPSLTVAVAADKVGTANITSAATNGPFTGGTVISVGPSSAGTAVITQTSGTVGVNATFVMTFTPTLHFSGNAVVSYTLSNAYAASAPATVTFQVAARPDPTLDPDVKGLIQAQNDTAIRVAEAQLSNFNQRLESLHAGGAGQSRNGISFQLGDGPDQPGPDDTPARNWDKIGLPKYFGARDSLDQPQGGVPKTAGGLSAQTGGAGGPRGLAASAHSGAGGDGTSGDATGSDAIALWSGGSIDLGMHRSGTTRSGLKFSTAGISVGGDYRVSDQLVVGLGGGYGQDKTDVGSNGSQDKATAYIGAVYGSWRPGEHAFIDGVLGYGRLRYDTRRYDAAVPEYEFGKRTGDEWFGSLTAAWEIRRPHALISPYGRFDFIQGSLDPFTEHGGVGALAYGGEDVRSLKSALGVRGDYIWPVSNGVWRPRFRVEYLHEFQDPAAFALQYADWLNGPTYQGVLDGHGRDQFVVGLGTDFRTRDTIISLDYKTNLTRASQTTNEIRAQVTWKF